jgi:hypothetical protein
MPSAKLEPTVSASKQSRPMPQTARPLRPALLVLIIIVIYRVFQKSLYRKVRYKSHLPLKYCITKIEFKAKLARHVC